MRIDWDSIIKGAITKYKTPFYLFNEDSVKRSIEVLKVLNTDVNIHNWYSTKTNPVKRFLKLIVNYDFGLEVVSEYEYLAALKVIKNPTEILINGVNKHTWLKEYSRKHLKVNFDSLYELEQLISYAKRDNWVIGLRFHPKVEVDPDNSSFSTQFGMTLPEISEAKRIIEKNNCNVSTIHFHIGTQVKEANLYKSAIEETIKCCKYNNLLPKYFSCGGGFPIEYNHNRYNLDFLKKIKEHLKIIPKELKSVKNIWLENGRFISGETAILVTKIHNIKYRDGMRFIICDGGRTNHALVSDWEQHYYSIYPQRKDQNNVLTTVCGPTCMSFDHFIRAEMPLNIRIGDYFIWYDAGAYHIPWETRFSNGLSQIVWHKDKKYRIIRDKESFDKWWGIWK